MLSERCSRIREDVEVYVHVYEDVHDHVYGGSAPGF